MSATYNDDILTPLAFDDVAAEIISTRRNMSAEELIDFNQKHEGAIRSIQYIPDTRTRALVNHRSDKDCLSGSVNFGSFLVTYVL